jgi:hypothetical protein
MKATYRYPLYCHITDGQIGTRAFTEEVASVEEAFARYGEDSEAYLVAIDGRPACEFYSAQPAPVVDDGIPF